VADNDEVTSLSAIGGSAQNGALAFATTHWSVVLTAQDESPAAQEALEKLCRTYWRPIYRFVRGQRLIPLEEIRERERIDVERSDRLTADQVYERHWAFTVLEQVMARLRDEYRSAGNLRFFDQMRKMLLDEPSRPSQAQVASEFDMTENAVKQAFYRFRQRYQTLLREEIAHTVAMPSDIEDELRHLIAVVRA